MSLHRSLAVAAFLLMSACSWLNVKAHDPAKPGAPRTEGEESPDARLDAHPDQPRLRALPPIESLTRTTIRRCAKS